MFTHAYWHGVKTEYLNTVGFWKEFVSGVYSSADHDHKELGWLSISPKNTSLLLTEYFLGILRWNLNYICTHLPRDFIWNGRIKETCPNLIKISNIWKRRSYEQSPDIALLAAYVLQFHFNPIISHYSAPRNYKGVSYVSISFKLSVIWRFFS